MTDSVRPHRRQPTRLPRPWDSLGKNTGVGCHFLLQCMKVKSQREVAQSCLTLSDSAAYQAPPSMGFSRQEYWSGVPLPSPDELALMKLKTVGKRRFPNGAFQMTRWWRILPGPEMCVWSLGQEDALEKEMAYSGLGNTMDRGTWLATVQGIARVKYDRVTERPH